MPQDGGAGEVTGGGVPAITAMPQQDLTSTKMRLSNQNMIMNRPCTPRILTSLVSFGGGPVFSDREGREFASQNMTTNGSHI